MLLAAPVRSNTGAKHISLESEIEQQEYTASDYVQDGLVVMYDGIENIGWGLHSYDTDKWIDLIGGNNLYLVQGIDYSINKDSVSANANITDKNELTYFSTSNVVLTSRVNAFLDCTVEIVFKVENIFDTGSIWKMDGGISYRTATGCCILRNGATSLDPVSPQRLFSINEKICMSSVQINRVNTTIINGEEHTGRDFSNGGVLEVFGWIQFGTRRPFGCTIYSIRIYRRALTSEELEYNHQIDKARFGL